MSYTYTDRRWWCPNCGRISSADAHSQCQHCDAPRTFEMTYAQAVAVARELNKGEEAQRIVAWHDRHRDIVLREYGLDEEFQYGCDTVDWLADRLVDARNALQTAQDLIDAQRKKILEAHENQSCGHEARLIVTGDDRDIGEPRGTTQYCLRCMADGLEKNNGRLREGLRYIAHHNSRFGSESELTHFAWCIAEETMTVEESLEHAQNIEEATDETG